MEPVTFSINILNLFLIVFGGGPILFCLWYIRLRMRWHKKGILHFNYDGHNSEQNPDGKTIFYYFKKEREYDREIKKRNKK